MNFRKVLIGLVLVSGSAVCAAQPTRINPTTQVNWTLITGSGAPTATCPSATVLVGQPYFDSTNNALSTCGTTGWIKAPIQPLFGATNPTLTCSSTVNNGAFYTNTAATALYQCNGSIATWVQLASVTGGVVLSSGIIKGTGSGSTNSTASAADLASTVTGTVTGSANAYVVTLSPVPNSIIVGTTVNFLPNSSNTSTTPTVTVAPGSAATVVKQGGFALAVNDLITTAIATVKWDGTNWELQNPQTLPSAGAGGTNGTIQLNVLGALGGYNQGADVVGTTGTILDSDGQRTTQYGMDFEGDSQTQITNLFGPTNLANYWSALLNAEINTGPTALNNAVAGAKVADIANYNAQKEAPNDAFNPIVIVDAMTNDTGTTPSTAAFIAAEQFLQGLGTWDALSSTSKIPPQSAGTVSYMYVTATGSGYTGGTDTVTVSCGASGTIPSSFPIGTAIPITSAGSGCVSASGNATTTSGSGTGMTVGIVANAIVTQSGTWATDSTFTKMPGLTTTTNASTLSVGCNAGQTGAIFVWAAGFNATNASTWQLSIDGSVATETFTGSTTIPSHISTLNPGQVSSSPIMGRFVTTPGSHTCLVTANISGGGAVTILGIGRSPSTRYRGNSSPAIFMTGVNWQANNAAAAATLAYNGYAQAICSAINNDGLMCKFLDIRSVTDPSIDFNAGINCPASSSPGLHGNDCWHRKVASFVEDELRVSAHIQPNANHSLASMLDFNPSNVTPVGNFLYGPCWYANPSNSFYACISAGGILNTNTFANLVSSNGFAIMEISPSSTSGWITHAWCQFTASSGTPQSWGSTTSPVTCPAQIGSNGLLLGSQAGKLASGTANSASTPIFMTAQINSATNTWLGDGWSVNVVPSAAGLNPGVALVVKNTSTVGTGTHSVWYQNSSGHGYQYDYLNSSFDAIFTNFALTASRTYFYPDGNGTFGFGLSLPQATPTFAVGTGVTSVVCASGFTCNNTRGELTLVGGTATTGTIATVTFSAALAGAPFCTVTQNGGVNNLGHGTPSTTAFTISAGVTVASSTVTIDYDCVP